MPTGLGYYLCDAYLPSSKQVSSSSSRNRCISKILERNTRSTSCVEQFPNRIQMTFGGAPAKTLRSKKSESFDTIVSPCSLAYSHTRSSLAPPSPKAKICSDPG